MTSHLQTRSMSASVFAQVTGVRHPPLASYPLSKLPVLGPTLQYSSGASSNMVPPRSITEQPTVTCCHGLRIHPILTGLFRRQPCSRYPLPPSTSAAFGY